MGWDINSSDGVSGPMRREREEGEEGKIMGRRRRRRREKKGNHDEKIRTRGEKK